MDPSTGLDAFPFGTKVPSGPEVLVFLRAAAGPGDDGAVDSSAMPEAEGDGQLRWDRKLDPLFTSRELPCAGRGKRPGWQIGMV